MHVREPAGVLVDAADAGVTDDQIRRGWGTVAWGFYGEFLKRLENQYGQNVHAVGYDWRQSLRRLGRYVGQKFDRIRETSGSDQLIVVTHSMGGLVARAAFAADPSLKSKVAGVVYVCQPAVGSVTLYRRMFTGLVPEFDATPEGGIGAKLFDRVFALILGGDRSDFLGKISGMPGAVSLLPNDHYPGSDASERWMPELAGSNTALDLFRKSVSPPGLMPSGKDKLADDVAADLKARINEYVLTQSFLGPPDDARTHHPNTRIIYGTGLPTETRVTRKGTKFVPDKTSRGDGTVPEASATALPVSRENVVAIVGLEHSAAFSAKDRAGEQCVTKAIAFVREIADAASGSVTPPADPLASFAVIGELGEAESASKIRELIADRPRKPGSATAGPQTFGTAELVPFGAFDWLNLRRDDPWRHTAHLFGYIPLTPSKDGPIDILPTSKAPKSERLAAMGLRITLDRLYVASYPGGGTHHVLLNFSALNQIEGGKEEELVHFNATYRATEREHAAVLGFPVFVGLNPCTEGLVLKCRTVNVKNQEDEGLIAFLDSGLFKKGLKLAGTFQPAVGQLSESAVGLFKFIAGRNRNVGVQQFELGLDFSDVATRGRLAEGSYVAIQYPGSKSAEWKWADVAYDPDGGRIYRKNAPDEPFDFNYVILGVSGMTKTPAASS